MFKNQASQTIMLYAVDKTTGLAKTGDSAQITVKISVDAASSNTSTNSIAEVDNGLYKLVLTQAETNGDVIAVTATSSTSTDILLQPTIYNTTSAEADIASLSDQIDGIGSGSGALNKQCIVTPTVTSGDETGTFADTQLQDGLYHQVKVATAETTVDVYYDFQLGGNDAPIEAVSYTHLTLPTKA